MTMFLPPILRNFTHEAMPSWRTRTFWCSTDLGLAMPSLIVGFVIALYAILLAEFAGVALYYGAGGEGALARIGRFLADDALAAPQLLFDVAAYGLCIVIGENIAPAALDIAAQKPFRRANSRRFLRAAIAGAGLIATMFTVPLIELLGDDLDISVAGAGVLAAAIAAAAFASLAGAFREGERLQAEQDLTI